MKLGIDLGTTNCTIGRIRSDGRRSIQGPIPSIGAYKNEKLAFGDEARRLLQSGDLAVHPVRDLKLSLGMRDVRIGPDSYSATELATKLIVDLVQRFGDAEEIEEAIIGTPVRVSREHRIALRKAAAGREKPHECGIIVHLWSQRRPQRR